MKNKRDRNMLITEFYRNRELFITGGTGYLGKSLIEKLLRDCPDISKIYLLIRSKKDKTPQERLNDFSKDLVFERLHRERPDAFAKLVPIVGDISEIGLGISEEDLERLKNVSIIFHGAANVRFDNNLRDAVIMNTRGTWELLKITLTLKHLISFIHISTAYINPNISYIEEKIYEAPVDWRSAIKIAETYDCKTLEIFKLKYLESYPNVYSFTKNLSEQVIADYSDKLPIMIVRPAIVAHSFKEPEPGFIDNLNGPMGLLVAIAVGISQVTYCNGNLNMALIHVDLISELTIISAYVRGLETKRCNKYHLEVRNFTAGDLYKYNLKQSTQFFLKYTNSQPFERSIWSPNCVMSINFYLFIMCVLFINIPLALLYDGLLMMSKKEKMVMKLTRKYVYTSKAVGKFSREYFGFQNDGMWDLMKYVPEIETEKFGNLKLIDASNHAETMKHLAQGVKKYIFKEPINSTTATKQRHKILIIIDKVIKLSIFLLAIRFSWKLVN